MTRMTSGDSRRSVFAVASGWARGPRAALLAVLIVVPALLWACRGEPREAAPEIGSESPAASPEERRRREERARALYEATRSLPPDEKVGALSDLAQVYHDTEAAPLAFLDLVFYLSDHSVDRPAEALAALESFARRRPEAPQLMTAANLLHAVAVRKRDEAAVVGDAEAGRDAARIAARALEIDVAAADRLLGGETVRDDVGSYYEIGNAYALAGRWADAERAWGLVEQFTKPADPGRRVDLLIRRAEVLRTKLDRRADALELFLKARALHETLGRAAAEEQRDHIDGAIAELRG